MHAFNQHMPTQDLLLKHIPKITSRRLYGFDIFIDKTGPKYQMDLSLVFAKILGADASGESGSVGFGVHMYSNSENRLTLTNMKIPTWFEKVFPDNSLRK